MNKLHFKTLNRCCFTCYILQYYCFTVLLLKYQVGIRDFKKIPKTLTQTSDAKV